MRVLCTYKKDSSGGTDASTINMRPTCRRQSRRAHTACLARRIHARRPPRSDLVARPCPVATTQAGTQRAAEGTSLHDDQSASKVTHRAGESRLGVKCCRCHCRRRRAWHLLMSRVVPWTVPGRRVWMSVAMDGCRSAVRLSRSAVRLS
jgi:hypothetical protein